MTPFDCPPEGAKTDCGICNLKSKCIEQFRIRHYDRTKITEIPITNRISNLSAVIDADRNQEIAIQNRFSLRRNR